MSLAGPALAWSALLALAVAATTAARSTHLVAFPLGWLVAWGPTAMVIGLCATGMRLSGRRSSAVLTLGLTALVALAPLAGLAEVLKRVTHHRPLGAATFAVLGAAVVVVVVVLASHLARPTGRHGRAPVLAYLVAGGGLLFTVAVTIRGLAEVGAGPLQSGLLEWGLVGAAVLAAAQGPSWKWAERPGLALGLWAATILVSSVVMMLFPAARLAITGHLPTVLPLAGWLGG